MDLTNDRTLLVAASSVGGESAPSRDAVTLTPASSIDQRYGTTNPVRRVGTGARWFAAWLARRRRANRNLRQLRELDSRTLHDLGLTRSELASVVAEVDGNAEATRRRIETSFITAASSGFRVRRVETYMSFAVLIGFGSVLLAAVLSGSALIV